MKLTDISDYFFYRRILKNPFEVVAFRKKRNHGDTISVRFESGQRLNLRGDRQDYKIFRAIFVEDEYRVKGFMRGDLPVVVDLGGNVGIFAARIAPVAGKVFTFEPMPENFERLVNNISNFDNVNAQQLAVGEKEGLLELFPSKLERASGMHSMYASEDNPADQDPVKVSMISLDQLFKKNTIEHCDLMKIDVEGAEYVILYGSSDETFAKIDRIHGEYHNVGDEEALKIENLAKFLQEKRFDVEIKRKRRQDNFGMFFATKK